MTDVHEFSDHLHTNTVRREVSEGIAENLANIDEESVDHINANTANNDLSSGIPEKLTQAVEGSEDTDAHQAVNNDDGVTKIQGTDSSRNTISFDQKTENSNGETISSGTESSSSTGKTPRFYVRQRFAELEDFLHFKKTFEDSNFCQLYNKDVRYLKAAEKRVPKRVALAKTSLKYYSLLLYCKFGGKPNASKERTRKTKSFRQGCPFQIYISLSSDGQALELRTLNESHNHSLFKELYTHLPRQRAMSLEEKKDVKDALNLKANKKLLQQKIEEKSGKKITLKDISNILQRTTNGQDQNDLDHVINLL